MPIQFRILGPLEVSTDGRLLPLGSPKQRALLALLLVHANETVSRDRLIEELWGDAAPASVESAFHVYLSRLRRLLDSAGSNGLLVRQAHGYRLRVEPDQLDATRFASLAGEGREALAAGKVELAADRLREALALWRGPALLELESERFAITAAARFEEERVAALEQRLEADLALGRDQELIGELETLVSEHPYRERLRAQLMLALYRSGRQAEALHAYQHARRTLADDLGLKPGHELKEFEQAILRQDPTLTLERATKLRTEPERPATEAAPVPVLERKRRTLPARRMSCRRAVGAFSAMLALGAATVAVIVATRGGNSHETTVAANAVGLIDARGDRVRDQVDVGGAPTSVAFGAGALWVTSAYANTVSRIDPETRSVPQTIAVGASPSGIAVGGGGVWVANHDDGTVTWINPQSNTVVKRIDVGNGPTAVAFGFKSVWVTNSDDRTVSRIDADTGDVVKRRIRTGAVGRGIAVGAGSVWVTDEPTGTVVRIDPATNRVTNKKTVGGGPAGIVFRDGTLWVANEFDGTVSKVEATTLSVRAAIPVGGSPSALALGRDGLWVSVEFGQRVVRIDTRTGRPSASIRVGNRPKGLVAVPGGVWVAVQASGTGHRGGRLVVLGDRFDSIDPGFAGAFNELGLAYDGLTAFRRVGGSEGTQLVADLAAGLPEPTDGGRSYTFRVRAGIRYSDGSLLRAQDFRRALERMLALGKPDVGGENSELRKVVGASECKKGRPCNLSRGVIVSGPNSLTIRLSSPDPGLLRSLASLVPVPGRTPPRDVGTRPIPSTGPYEIDSYVPGRLLTFVRNSHFRSWSKRARPNGYPDEVVWRIGVRPDEAVRQVIDRKADLLFNKVPGDRVDELAARYPHRLHLVPQRATAFVFLNTRRAPFDDLRVRQALNYAVDRGKMAALHGGSVAKQTCQTVPPNVPGYRRYCPYTADPDSSGDWKAPDLEKARALVAASGTKSERIVVWTFPFFGKEGRYFVSLLRRLGYRAQLKELEDRQTYFATLNRTPSVQAGLAGWFNAHVAADWFETLNCDFVFNWAHFCDRRFDREVKRLAAAQAYDPAADAALAARLDREVVDRAPWVPLFTPSFADFASQRVGNYQTNTHVSDSVLLDQLWVR